MKTALACLIAAFGAWAFAGQLEVVVAPSEKVKKVQAISRGASGLMNVVQTTRDLKPAGENGHFIVEDLPAGVYDICIGTVEHTIEGVTLDVNAAKDEPVFHWWLPGDRLAADNYDPASEFEEGAKVSDDEKTEAIRKKFRLDSLRQCFETLTKVKRFENFLRVVYAAGTSTKVKALVELRRDGGFYADKGGEVIWRAEVWQFTWEGAWSAQNRGAKVLERHRFPPADYEKFDKLYDPKLGGVAVKDGEKTTLEYELPAALDDKMGKPRKAGQ